MSDDIPASVPEVIVRDNVFHDNLVNTIIYNYEYPGSGHKVVIERNHIYNNTSCTASARNQRAIVMFEHHDTPAVVRNNFIYNNDWSILSNRSVIYCWDSDNKKIYNNTLYNNNTSGGEIHVDANSTSGVEVKIGRVHTKLMSL